MNYSNWFERLFGGMKVWTSQAGSIVEMRTRPEFVRIWTLLRMIDDAGFIPSHPEGDFDAHFLNEREEKKIVKYILKMKDDKEEK